MPGGKLGLAFAGISAIVLLAAIPFALKQEIETLRSITGMPVAFSIKAVSLPMLSATPAFLAVIWAVVKRWKNTYTPEHANKVIKIAAINCPITLLVVFVQSWGLSTYLSNHGYEPCRAYTGSSIHAPKTWVIEPEYCIKEGSTVSYDLVRWTQEQANLGNRLSIIQVRQKIEELSDNTKPK